MAEFCGAANDPKAVIRLSVIAPSCENQPDLKSITAMSKGYLWERILMIIRLLLLVVVAAPASAGQWENSPSTWEKTLATTASLRTGGAYLVSSDAIKIDGEKTALVTYWQWSKGLENTEVYRCVDIVATVDCEHAAQKCWKVLRARGRP